MPKKGRNIIRIAHTADGHLRHSQFGSKQRGQHFYSSFRSAITTAHRNGASVIVNSGDFLDKNRQRTENIHQLVEIDKYLKELEIPMYTITGNHDMDTPTWMETLFSDRSALTPGIVPLDNRTVNLLDTSITIGGMPTFNVNSWLELLAARTHETLPDIVVWHGSVGGFMQFDLGLASWEQVLAAAPRTRLFLLGDLHVHKYYQQEGRWIGYPGPVDMCSIDEDENKYIRMFELDVDTGEVLKSWQVSIESTPVIRINMENEETSSSSYIAQAVAEVDSNPFSLVHLVFDAQYQKEAAMLTSLLDREKCIIRRKRVNSGFKITNEKGERVPSLTPADLVDKFIAKDNMFYSYAKELAMPGVDFKVTIERLIYEHAPQKIKAL